MSYPGLTNGYKRLIWTMIISVKMMRMMPIMKIWRIEMFILFVVFFLALLIGSVIAGEK